MVEIEGYSEDQIAAVCEMWKLGSPVDVSAFLDRADIPEQVKKKVREAGASLVGRHNDATQADAYRLMQICIIIEVIKLDKRWSPSE